MFIPNRFVHCPKFSRQSEDLRSNLEKDRTWRLNPSMLVETGNSSLQSVAGICEGQAIKSRSFQMQMHYCAN